MCGRYTLYSNKETIAKTFSLSAVSLAYLFDSMYSSELKALGIGRYEVSVDRTRDQGPVA